MSLSIGQGELLITPLQIANIVACIANRGYYMTPHIVRPSEQVSNYVEKHIVPIDRKNFEIVIDGMQMAAGGGTARSALSILLLSAGKRVRYKILTEQIIPYLWLLHPKENPKIAIAVYVENGIWGATYAAPIAGLIMEKYLTGKISPRKKDLEQRMMNANLLPVSKQLKNAENEENIGD